MLFVNTISLNTILIYVSFVILYELYHIYISSHLQSGAAYKCYCTQRRLELLRKAASRNRETFKYDNRCRYLDPSMKEEAQNSNKPYVVRLKVFYSVDRYI